MIAFNVLLFTNFQYSSIKNQLLLFYYEFGKAKTNI